MHTRLNAPDSNNLLRVWRIVLLLGIAASGSLVVHAQQAGTTRSGPYYTVKTVIEANGTAIEEAIINGPPIPPPGFDVQRQAVSLPKPDRAAGINILTVPAFNWVFGCSAVSGAMIAGYHDRTGYPNMYTGPTNGGIMPLNNSFWPTWSDGTDTYPNCPLIASKNGVDDRTTRGSIDDYWIQYGSVASDPYIAGSWAQHAWGDAIGDYMKTSQSAFGNTDGATTFYNYGSESAPLTCADMETYDYIVASDGTYGRKLFYEARGYTCTECYNQKTDNTITGGFSFAQLKVEIDAGRPVMLNLAGHTVVAVGYDDATNQVYIHDTWDDSNHTMTWGGSYSGMELLSVSIVNLTIPTTFASFSPTSGPVGAIVTLTGIGFSGATKVTFNGKSATTFIVDSATQIRATVPSGATTGKIYVITPGGTTESASSFTVITFDLNGDGRVDLKDLARIARYFGTLRADDPDGFPAQYDLNGDSSIDEEDVTLLFNHLD